LKKTDGLTKAIGILLFLAMFCYMGFAVLRRVTNRVQTVSAVGASVSESAAMNGMVIREEEPVLSEKTFIDITASEAEKLAVGSTIATVYTSADALDRALRMHELESSIRTAETAAETVGTGSGAIYAALGRLSRAVQSGKLAELDLIAAELSSMVLEPQTASGSADDIQALRSEYNRLAEGRGQDGEAITSDRAGLFSRVTDGMEALNGEAVRELSPVVLRQMLEQQSTPAENAIGKMVYGVSWYYAALVDAADAARLAVGEERELRFNRYCAYPLSATVEAVSAPADGECAVLFSLDEGMAEMLSVRKAASELVFEEHSGIRVPQEGLYRYYAGYMDADKAETLRAGDAVTLSKGAAARDCTVSEIGDVTERDGVSKRLVVLCWSWEKDNILPDAPGAAVQTATNGAGYALEDLYSYDEQTACCCVFTMTGLQAERRKVTPVYLGDGYCLVESTGEDALRAGNEIIVRAMGLYNGKVFD